MKKIIFLGILIISNFVFADKVYTFKSDNSYCIKPNYNKTALFYDDNNEPYVAIGFQECYHKGEKIKGGPFTVYRYNVNQTFYREVLMNRYLYLFFENNKNIEAKEKSDGTYWKTTGGIVLKNEFKYPRGSDWR